MVTRLTIDGRVRFRNEFDRKQPITQAQRDNDGEQVFYGPVTDEDGLPLPRPIYSSGAWRDNETGLTHRVVDRDVLRMDQGWASIDYWQRELRCTWAVFLRLCREGFFDLAASPPTVRYRCRDYQPTMDRVRKLQKAPRLRGRYENPR